MKIYFLIPIIILFTICSPKKQEQQIEQVSQKIKTTIAIEGENFLINKLPTLKGVVWNDINMEGLLPNSRMVQGIFDDMNPETAIRWAIPSPLNRTLAGRTSPTMV